ncbi:hypothetical protein [Lewinella sp. JB7]|uniref:hypothetical protein n=1 Tax=Lewinella sp. JB7 TaxID=2962887 RepID=UPI0020C95D3D|nr:hypothetical protein [Lewinella sp. JB7]MCP9237161.1 hypothetical protein [Lewinella sp. JB7]
MASLLHSTGYTLAGDKFDVYLDRGEPGGIPLDIKCRSLRRTYRSAGDNANSTLLASKLSVTFYVTTQAQKDALFQLTEASELEFCLRLLLNDQLEWAGFVLMDLVSVEFGVDRYDFTVAATDGLARLKEIDYDPKGIEGFDHYLAHLYRIFTEMPLARYFGPGQVFLSVHSTLWPDQLTPALGVAQLELLRINIKALRTVDAKGEIKYRTFYQVLEELLRMLGARLTFAGGRYYLVETVDYSRQDQVLSWHDYDAWGQHLDGRTPVGWYELSTEINGSDSTALAGGNITFLPPLKGVTATYRHFSRQNLLPGENGTWGRLSAPVRKVRNFRASEGAGQLLLSGKVSIKYTPQASVTIPLPGKSALLRLAVRMAIAEDDDANNGDGLAREVIITAAGATYKAEEWKPGGMSNACYFVFSMPPLQFSSGTTVSFNITTPVVPRSGTLYFSISGEGLYQDAAPIDPAAVDYTVSNLFLESLLTGSIDDQYNETVFEVANQSEYRNSAALETVHLFGDGPGDNTFGRIESLSGEDNFGQPIYELTSGWRRWDNQYYLDRDSIGSLAHTELCAWMALGLQRVQRERLDISVRTTGYAPHMLLVYDSKVYLCEDGEQDVLRDEWRGSWLHISFRPPPPPEPPRKREDIGSKDPLDISRPELPLPGSVGRPGTGGGGGEREAERGAADLGIKRTQLNSLPTVLTREVVVGLPEEEPTTVRKINLGRPPSELPIYRDQRLFLTDPATGAKKTVRARFDYELGVETDAGDPDARPYYEADGTLRFLKQSGGDLEVEDEDGEPIVLPAGSYVQYDPGFVLQSVNALRAAPFTAVVAGYDTPLFEGYLDWFWYPTALEGHELRGVTFSLVRNPTAAAVKINLKYFDDGEERYTVATYQGSGRGGHVAVRGIIRGGYYRLQVERIDGDSPRGLQLTIDTVRRLKL